jgi:ABC-2 type transport system permease protein
MAVAADLRTAVTNAINATTDVNRLTSKATNNIIPLPLYNPTLGYESFIMPLVFIIILQQTLIFTSSMLIALRNSIGLTKINSSQFIGTFLGCLWLVFLERFLCLVGFIICKGIPMKYVFTGFVDCSFFCGSKFNGDVDW